MFWDTKERLPKPDLSGLKRLRFLTTTDFPPFNFLDGDGRLSGFHVDLAREICLELGISDKCEIQVMPWAGLEQALISGRGEAIIAGIAVTEETRSKYAFSRLLPAVSGALRDAEDQRAFPNRSTRRSRASASASWPVRATSRCCATIFPACRP